jgi:hypothetical protein
MRKYLEKYPKLLQHYLFTFTRLIQDHGRFQQLQQKELSMVVELIHTHVPYFDIVWACYWTWSRLSSITFNDFKFPRDQEYSNDNVKQSNIT